LAKTQTQRTNEYRARIKEERDALQAENAELKRRLAEINDTPAQPSPLEKLSPVARATFDEMRPTLRGATDGEKIADVIEGALLALAKNRAKTAAPPEAAAPGPAVAGSMTEREIIEGIYGQLIDQVDDDQERDVMRTVRDEMLAEGLYEVASDEFTDRYDRLQKEVKKKEAKLTKLRAKWAAEEAERIKRGLTVEEETAARLAAHKTLFAERAAARAAQDRLGGIELEELEIPCTDQPIKK
jgi:hypothetical protein